MRSNFLHVGVAYALVMQAIMVRFATASITGAAKCSRAARVHAALDGIPEHSQSA